MCRGPVLFKGIIKSGWLDEKEPEPPIDEFTEWVFNEMENGAKIPALRVIEEAQVLCKTATDLGYDKYDIEYMIWTFDWISPKHLTRNGPRDPPKPSNIPPPRKNKGKINKKQRWMRSRI